MWEPQVLERFDLPHGTLFIVVCEASFDRKPGQDVKADGAEWKLWGWDDHRTALSPSNGEHIAILCRSADDPRGPYVGPGAADAPG